MALRVEVGLVGNAKQVVMFGVCAQFSVEPTAPGDARRFVRSTLGEWGYAHALIEDAELVVSEFATNAILHAHSPFGVEIKGRAGGVRIAVADADQASPHIRVVGDPLDPSGRGLRLVEAVAACWGFERTADGKTVWAELAQ